MPWATKVKDLGSSAQTPHTPTATGVTGRAPSVTSITFTPLEFFGATARCLHMHVINPAVVMPESLIVSALVEQHVDDISAPFAVLSSADRFKDYAKSYFAGTVAAGLAYLQMIAEGYVRLLQDDTLRARARVRCSGTRAGRRACRGPGTSSRARDRWRLCRGCP